MSPWCLHCSGSGCDPEDPGLGHDPGSREPCPACDGTGDSNEEEETGR